MLKNYAGIIRLTLSWNRHCNRVVTLSYIFVYGNELFTLDLTQVMTEINTRYKRVPINLKFSF